MRPARVKLVSARQLAARQAAERRIHDQVVLTAQRLLGEWRVTHENLAFAVGPRRGEPRSGTAAVA